MTQHLGLVTPKPHRKSRTIWLNGLTALVTGVFIMGDMLDLAAATGIAVDEDVTKYVLFAVGLANIWLRRATTQPIGNPQP